MTTTVSKDAPCGNCQVLVCGKDQSLECDICGLWYHVGCSNASAQCYEIITENGGLTWICSACRAALLFAVTKTRTINAENAAMRAQLSEMYNEIKSLQETFSQRDAIESATANAHNRDKATKLTA